MYDFSGESDITIALAAVGRGSMIATISLHNDWLNPQPKGTFKLSFNSLARSPNQHLESLLLLLKVGLLKTFMH